MQDNENAISLLHASRLACFLRLTNNPPLSLSLTSLLAHFSCLSFICRLFPIRLSEIHTFCTLFRSSWRRYPTALFTAEYQPLSAFPLRSPNFFLFIHLLFFLFAFSRALVCAFFSRVCFSLICRTSSPATRSQLSFLRIDSTPSSP